MPSTFEERMVVMQENEERVAAHQGAPMDASVIGIVATVARRKRLVFVVASVVIAIGLVFALLKERTWTTNFSFLPTAEPDGGRAGLASLAGQFGLALPNPAGSARPPQFYADLLRSREILTPIAAESVVVADGRKLPISELLEIRGDDRALVLDKTILALQRDIIGSSVAARTTGVVSARVRTPDQAASARIAERLLEELNAFNIRSRSSSAGEERRFVSEQLEIARDSLRAAEERLKAFMLANRTTGSPNITFERDRLQRVVASRNTVVDGLNQAFNEARIREVRDTPVLALVDRPSPAVQHDARGRVVLMIGVAFGGLVVGVLVALLVDSMARPGPGGTRSLVQQLGDAWRGA
jgi:uncharacterized protein involved in exopolysaccharide biosynthesis